MIRWMITVLLRLTPDMEDKELEEIDKQTGDQEVDASLGGGEILLQAIPEEICNRAQRLFEQLRVFSVLLTKCCSDLVIDLMQVGYIRNTLLHSRNSIRNSSPSHRLLRSHDIEQ